jgi:charged multivesicular body protein 6
MFSIEEIEQIMEDSAEAIAKQKEIDELLSGQLTQEDEDDVLKELEDMVAAAGADDVKVSQLPEVPTDELPGEVNFLHSCNSHRSSAQNCFTFKFLKVFL